MITLTVAASSEAEVVEEVAYAMSQTPVKSYRIVSWSITGQSEDGPVATVVVEVL